MKFDIRIFAAGLLAAVSITPVPADAAEKEKLRVAIQQFFPSFPVYAAEELGIYDKWDLDVEIKLFPSGAPIVQAAPAYEWDVAHLGAPPLVQGSKLGLITVGAISEEASIHQLVGRPEFIAQVKADPSKLKGISIFVTTASTGHFMTEGCLKKHGLTVNDVQILPSEQQASLSAFIAGNGDLAQLWPPASTAARERGMDVFCDGPEAGIKIPSVWVIHPKAAETVPDASTRWLRATLETVGLLNEIDQEKVVELYRAWDSYRGLNTSEMVLMEEVELATDLWPLEKQAEMMISTDGQMAYTEEALTGISEFFIRIGRMSEVPDMSKLIDVSWIEKAAALPARD